MIVEGIRAANSTQPLDKVWYDALADTEEEGELQRQIDSFNARMSEGMR